MLLLISVSVSAYPTARTFFTVVFSVGGDCGAGRRRQLTRIVTIASDDGEEDEEDEEERRRRRGGERRRRRRVCVVFVFERSKALDVLICPPPDRFPLQALSCTIFVLGLPRRR